MAELGHLILPVALKDGQVVGSKSVPHQQQFQQLREQLQQQISDDVVKQERQSIKSRIGVKVTR